MLKKWEDETGFLNESRLNLRAQKSVVLAGAPLVFNSEMKTGIN